MKILVLGDDGRTHALVWKLFNSPHVQEVLCAPGNGGTSQIAPGFALDDLTDAAAIAHWAFREGVDVIVPASSTYLEQGITDESLGLQVGVFGPPRSAIRMEQSRCYAKEWLLKHNLPTARGQPFDNVRTAEKYLAAQTLPVVLRADHPTEPEGVYHDRYQALKALHAFFEGPQRGHHDGVVIESALPGISVSFSALTDGITTLPLMITRHYDHLEEGDTGPLAPGMGAHTGISPYASRLTEYMQRHLMQPMVATLAQINQAYWGVLGIDCMITQKGPLITALRCSFRDMEAQVVLPRLENDLVLLIQAVLNRRLSEVQPLQWRKEASVGLALVAQGYPHHFPVGSRIEGLDRLEEGVLVFHHQTENPLGLKYVPRALQASHGLSDLIRQPASPRTAHITTSGGHVLTVVALGATLNGARGRALINAERMTFAGRFFRGDIGSRAFT